MLYSMPVTVIHRRKSLRYRVGSYGWYKTRSFNWRAAPAWVAICQNLLYDLYETGRRDRSCGEKVMLETRPKHTGLQSLAHQSVR